MKHITKSSFLLAFILLSLLMLNCKQKSIYQDSTASIEARVADLISKMTLDEKILLLSGDTTGFDTHPIQRLGIPAIHVTDGPLGVRTGKATSFPAGVAVAASWDTILIHELSAAMAQETKAKGRDYLLGPCVCIQRSPFGGRNFETYSEDPYLASRLAVNWVKGLQSEKVIASVKHFAMNDQEWERNNYNVVADERTMREIHLPAFEAAVIEGNAWSVMSAYNKVNGQHCSENFHLLKDILKGDWGFKGFVISDWVSVYNTANAANAGLDLEMPTGKYFCPDSIQAALKAGKITEAVINEKTERILRIMFLAGLFENRPAPDTTVLHGDAHKQLTLKAAEEGIVLLKNDNNFLPLNSAKLKSIAIIGPNAKICRTGGGGSSIINPYYSVSPFEGLSKKLGDKVKINFAEGDKLSNLEVNPIKTDYFISADRKGKGLNAEYFNNADLKGTPVLTQYEKTVMFKWGEKAANPQVGKSNYSIRLTGFLKVDKTKDIEIYTVSDDGVRLFINDKVVIENWGEHGDNLNTYSFKIEAGKEYKLKLEYFQHSGGATLELGWNYDQPESDINPIQEAVEAAKASEVAVIFAGLASSIEGEGADPGTMNLPNKQKELIEAVCKANPNTLVVLNGGITFNVEPWLKNAKGLIDMFYLGQETGNAIASVILGEVNPSGKMPFSFIKDPSQSPAMKDYMKKDLQVPYNEGVFVGYRYLDQNKLEPQFPFGFGLSYTSFEYSNIKVKELDNRNFEVTADIQNTGKVNGDEIVQLYVSEKICPVPRPIKELKGFSRVSLKAGEKKTITMKLKNRDFAFWDVKSNGWKVEPGSFDILIGSSSRDIKLTQTIVLK